MPIFYNTALPTPTTKNTINEIAVGYGLRDFLLNLNLLPQYPQISTNINGSPRIGEPVLDTVVGTGNILIPIGLPLETNGLIFKDLNVLYNTFQNDPNVSNILEDIDFTPAIQNPDFTGAIWPTNSQYPTGANTQVEQYGIKGKTETAQYRKDNVIKNLYLDETSQIDMADFIGLYPLNTSQQLGNYIDTFGSLAGGGPISEGSANIIGSVLNGQGVGLGAGGSVIPNFDFKSSLLGRVLGAAGFVKDTKLGNVGAQQLSLALANNAAFNVQQEILGALNIKENIFSLIKGDGFAGFRPNYKITIPKSTGGKILNAITRVLGFQIPRSYLDDDGSIFQSENGDAANIDRANSMILNTGKGQIKALISNVLASSSVNSNTQNPFRSGYAPAYKNNKGDEAIPNEDTKLYAYSNEGNVNKLLGNSGDIIPEINYNREAMTRDSGFESPDDNFVSTAGFINPGYDSKTVNSILFSWSSDKDGTVNKLPNISALGLDFTAFGGSALTPVETNLTGDKKSLLVKTQELFNSRGMKTLVSVKGEMGYDSTQIQTANNDGISKGSAVISKNRYDLERGVVNSSGAEAEDNFCRSWTTLDRYDSIKKLIRNKPLYKDPEAPYRFQVKNSVLDGPFVKIAPYITDVPTDPKKYMFSIENLAWSDKVEDLPPCEKGPGDLISGQQGRIMWFPPYDIQISESNSVSWDETNFIGRGEPIYTYSNTKRTGQLSFKVIVDHPSYYNAFNARRNQTGAPDDNYIASFFAGCVDTDKRFVDKLLKKEDIDRIEIETTTTKQIRQEPTDPPAPGPMKLYYPNDIKDYVPTYEDGKCSDGSEVNYEQNCDGFGCGLSAYTADITQDDVNGKTETWEDRFDYGLNAGRISTERIGTEVDGKTNYGYNDVDYSVNMIEFLKKYPWAVLNFQGFASPQGNPKSNTKLADLRAKTLKDKLLDQWGSQLGVSKDKLEKRFKTLPGKALTSSDVPDCPFKTGQSDIPVDILPCKLARRTEISVTFDKNLKAEYIKSLEPLPDIISYENYRITGEIRNKFYTECDYFEKLSGNDTKFVFDSIREKIRYFHPAFHSMTPEGLNSRLTFLLQCTRQGPTLENISANNLAFGRPPICILRIGDFYNTKIVIDSVNISYEPLIWDLNPEGIGVQPMLANVDMSFSFIGGSSLMGPISKLQNALSFNYFANTQVYDPRADYIAKKATVGVGELSGGFEEALTPGASTTFTQGSELATEPTFNYMIVDGVSYKEYISNLDKKLTRELINGANDNQIKQEEVTNSGPENQSSATTSASTSGTTSGDTENDIEVVSSFNIEMVRSLRGMNDGFNDKWEENAIAEGQLSMGFGFVYHPTYKTKTELTKTYRGKVYIVNGVTNEKRQIFTMTLSPNNQETIKVGAQENGQTTDFEERLLEIKVGTVKDSFIIGEYSFQNFGSDLVAFILKAYKSDQNSTVVLEWNTGYKPRINFSAYS
jgi:hypothetical protein